jgi:hypothetical protein
MNSLDTVADASQQQITKQHNLLDLCHYEQTMLFIVNICDNMFKTSNLNCNMFCENSTREGEGIDTNANKLRGSQRN